MAAGINHVLITVKNQMNVDRLPELRAIGWTIWDPLKLHSIGWCEQGGQNEYDSYLLHTLKMLEQGSPCKEVIKYLIDVEVTYMGMDGGDAASVRARMTVDAIASLILKEAMR